MCTSTAGQTPVPGSGDGSDGWFSLRTATVNYDHAVHTPAWHTLNIDFANPAEGDSDRLVPGRARRRRQALFAAGFGVLVTSGVYWSLVSRFISKPAS